jgi:hypothetical protein
LKTKSQARQPHRTRFPSNGADGKPPPEEVAVFAYLIWEQGGRTHCHDVDDWLKPERQIEATRLRESVAG